MRARRRGRNDVLGGILAVLAIVGSARAEETASTPSARATAQDAATDSDALRKAAQNPIANMISVPFQNNTNFDVGPYHRPQNVLNFQPVIPVHINDNWNLITRWITPVVYQPRLSPEDGAEFGLGNLQPAFFLSPAHSSGLIWGVGVQTWLPTATDKTLGVNKWGAGPAAVALTMQGPWVYGMLVNNVWAGREPCQPTHRSAVPQLQPARRLVSHLVAHHHLELGCQGFQEDADMLSTWYSGWYNGLAKKHYINVLRGKEAEHEVIVYCKANPDVKIIKAIDIVFTKMRKEQGIVLSK